MVKFSIQRRAFSIQLYLMLFFLLSICARAWPADESIAALRGQISSLEEQKAKFEAEKQKLVDEGDELSHKIEALKIQAKGGLGIIGRYRLSRSLRKAQALSAKIRDVESKINRVEGQLKEKRKELEGEYERQIAVLLEELNVVSQAEERRSILEKVKEYQSAKEQLVRPEKEELEHLDIDKIEIKEYDGPQEIREKADLINDFAGKLGKRINMLNARVGKLQEELKTRQRLGEFAEEISFFGERISREEITSDAGEQPSSDDSSPVILAGKPEERKQATFETDTFAEDANIEMPPVTESSKVTEAESSAAPDRIVMERNGVSADFAGTSLDQIIKEIKLLQSQQQALKNELAVLSEKASSFYKKADEIEKSEIKKGAKKR